MDGYPHWSALNANERLRCRSRISDACTPKCIVYLRSKKLRVRPGSGDHRCAFNGRAAVRGLISGYYSPDKQGLTSAAAIQSACPRLRVQRTCGECDDTSALGSQRRSGHISDGSTPLLARGPVA